MELDFIIVMGIIAVVYNFFLIRLLWNGIRSIMKKPINFPPSERKWARVYADVVDEEMTERVIDPEPYSFQDVSNRRSGRTRITTPRVEAVKSYKVRYVYEGSSYETEIAGYSVRRKGAVIYCRRDNPEIAKEFIPNPGWTTEAALSALFVAGLMILFEIVIFI